MYHRVLFDEIHDMTTDYRSQFFQLFDALKKHPLFVAMEQTVEDSPWHREANVLVHTEMVVNEYVVRADLYHSDECRADPEWTRATYLGAVACAFHDVGKPGARTEKFSEARGKYYSYPGHELLSARLFDNYAADHTPLFTCEEMYTIGWMIEHHMPWDITDKTKRANMAATVKLLGVDTFLRVLMSDQFGRISDDAATKRESVRVWVDEFYKLVEDTTVTVNWDSSTPTAWMPIAPSGSGKSTFLKRLEATHGPVNVFSLDRLRHQFYDTDDYAKAFQASVDDPKFDSRAKAQFYAMKKEGKDMYLDNTNGSVKRRRQYVDELRKSGYRVIAVVMPVTLQTLYDRQLTRGDKNVPKPAVRQQYMSMQLPSWGEFDAVVVSDHNLI